MTVYSGFTATTAEKLLLDAGAFFKDFIVGTDTYATAVTASKLLGATQGGGTFSAVPSIRDIPIDGVKGRAKGLQSIDEWVVTLTVNVKEVSEEILTLALGTGVSAEGTTGYKTITAGNDLVTADYVTNITWVGRLSGQALPVIIVVKNALSTGGLTLATADKSESTIALTFEGHYDSTELDSPPFEIHYPDPAVI